MPRCQSPLTAKKYSTAQVVDGSYLGEMVRAKIVEQYGEEEGYTGGFKVYTTLDTRLQTAANVAVRNGLLAYEERHDYRGPLGTVDLAQLQDEPYPPTITDDQLLTEDDEAAEAPEPADFIQRSLAAFPTYEDIVPALVTEINDEQAGLTFSPAVTGVLAFENMKWARRLVNGSPGPEPEKPQDVLALGDIIYVQSLLEGEGFKLVQLPRVEGALVGLDPNTGAIRSLVGGFDFNRSKFNRAIQAMRQPGSNFKPFIYSAALEKRLHPSEYDQ